MTECGENKFRISDDTGGENANLIADVLIGEMKKVDDTYQSRRKSKPYSNLLLSSLNIADKYVQLRHRYNHILKQLEELEGLYQRQSSSSPVKQPTVATPSKQPPSPHQAVDNSLRQGRSTSVQKQTVSKPEETRKTTATEKTLLSSSPSQATVSSVRPPPASSPSSVQAPARTRTETSENAALPGNTVHDSRTDQASVSATGQNPAVSPLPEQPPAKREESAKIEKPAKTVATAQPSPPSSPLNQAARIETPEPAHLPPSRAEKTEMKPKVGAPSLHPPQPSQSITPEYSPQPAQPVNHTPLSATTGTTTPGQRVPAPLEEPQITAELEQSAPASPSPQPAHSRIAHQPPVNRVPGHSAQNSQEAFHHQSTDCAPVANPVQPLPVDKIPHEFQLPPHDFLRGKDIETEVDHEAIRTAAELLEQKLSYFGITGEVMEVLPGPVITTFEYKPAPGVKISKIVNLADDLALALSALSIRIVAPIPGKDVIGIEIPNSTISVVPFIDIVSSQDFKHSKSMIPICLGKDIIGNPVVVELDKMPHLLIAGATGTGKSVGLNAMIASMLYKSSPDKVKLIMIDPKRIELSLFNDIPHLITPVITDMRKANIALQWVVREMERRYDILAKLQVRNIEQYNRKIQTDLSGYEYDEPFEEFPYIVIIIDELADLMMTGGKDIEFSLTRIAQMARAAGIHLIIATQRASVDVLTGIIKANFPTRISFQVSSKIDSRTIIDCNGAETLLGSGDMLFVPPGIARLTRVHGTYISEEELINIADFLKSQSKPNYLHEVTCEKEEEQAAVEHGDDDYDDKYQAALEYTLAAHQVSISRIQRTLRVGYNRAARIIDLMEKKGVIGPPDGVKPRQVLINSMDQVY